MKRLFLLLSLVTFTIFVCGLSHAAPRRNPLRIATMNMPKIYRKLPAVQKATLYLKSRKEDFQKDLDRGTKDLYAKMKDIKEARGKVPADELKKKEQEWRRLKFDLDLKFQKMKEKLQKLEKHEFEVLKRKIDDAIQRVVRTKRLDLVLEKQWLYYGDTIDITDDVLSLLLKETGAN